MTRTHLALVSAHNYDQVVARDVQDGIVLHNEGKHLVSCGVFQRYFILYVMEIQGILVKLNTSYKSYSLLCIWFTRFENNNVSPFYLVDYLNLTAVS